MKIFDKDFGIHLFEHLDLPDKIRSMQSTMAELQKCYLFYKSQVCPQSISLFFLYIRLFFQLYQCLSSTSLCLLVFLSVCLLLKSVCLFATPSFSLPEFLCAHNRSLCPVLLSVYILMYLIYLFIQIAAIEKKERDKRKSKKRRKSKQRTSSISKNDKSAEKAAAEQPSPETDSKEVSKEIPSCNNELIN